MRRDGGTRSAGGGLGSYFGATLGVLGLGLLAVFVLTAAMPEPRAPDLEDPSDPTPDLRALIDTRAAPLQAWRRTLAALCNDAELQGEGLAPDCGTGAITIGDDLFQDATSPQLSEEGMRKLQFALPRLLKRLRAEPEVWERLEAIEFRGHADPRARKDPYVTNLVGSGQRPLGVMLYLVSDWALDTRDRRDLERLAIISASSHMRPPEACPEETRSCYPFWRRVEVIPVMQGARMREEMSRTLQQMGALLAPPAS